MVMLCTPIEYEEAKKLMATGDWVVQPKFDGIRAYIKAGRLYDRNDKDITEKFPEFIGIEEIAKKGMLDGEIIWLPKSEDEQRKFAISTLDLKHASFSNVQSRIHQQSNFKFVARLMPCTFVAFDYVGYDKDGKMCNEEYRIRRVRMWGELFKLGELFRLGNLRFPQLWIEVTDEGIVLETAWEVVQELQAEGLVLKNKHSVYENRRSNSWRKLKLWKDCEAEFTKMTEHGKGVRLETADGKSVTVNGMQANEVKKIFGRDGKVRGEVQYMRQETGDAWRMPTWKRLVGDA